VDDVKKTKLMDADHFKKYPCGITVFMIAVE
jgi:hypothetical protein